MMVMVVMMVAASHSGGRSRADGGGTVLSRPLQLHRNMADPMLSQFLADAFLYRVGVGFGDDVQGGGVIGSVHAPNVEVVNVRDSVNGSQMGTDLCSIQP